MKNAREPIWDYSPLNRVLLWTMASVSVLALPPFFLILGLGALFVWIMHNSGDKISLTNEVIPIFAVATMVAFLPLLAGTLIGFVGVICAPATEPMWPLQSAFFRTVMAQTLMSWALAFPAIYWVIIVLWDYYCARPISDAMPFVVGFILFPLCLCHGLQLARRNARSSV